MSRIAWVKIILLILIGVSSLALWWSLKFVLYTAPASWSFWVLPVLFLDVVAVALTLLVLLMANSGVLTLTGVPTLVGDKSLAKAMIPAGQSWHNWLAIGLLIGTFPVFFRGGWYVWPVMLVAMGVMAYQTYKTTQETRLRLCLDLPRLLKLPLIGLMTAMALLSAYAWYVSPLAVKNVEQLTIPRPVFNLIWRPISLILLKNINNLNSGKINLDLTDTLKSLNLPFDIGIVNNVEVSNNQLALKSSDLISEDQAYQLVNEQFRGLLANYRRYLHLSLALALFGALKTISIPLMYCLLLVSWGIVKLLLTTGLVLVEKQTVEQEIIRIKN